MTDVVYCAQGIYCRAHMNAEIAFATLEGAALKAALDADMDLYAVVSQRKWRNCTCDMWARIQAVVGHG